MKTYRTAQRNCLLQFLKENSDRAFTIEEIVEALEAESVAKSTVYRLMTKLTEENLVHRTVKGNSRSFVYQYISDETCENHLHIKCTDCGKVYHLDSGITSIIQNDIKANTSFEIDSHTVLLGKCGNCK